MAGGYIAGRFVACGGFYSTSYNTCYTHNNNSNTWQLMPPLPQQTVHQKATSLGNLLLTTGGGVVSADVLANSQAFQGWQK